MRKRILAILYLAVCCLMLPRPLGVHATTSPDPGTPASLTLYYQKDNQAFPDLPIEIYRVAEALPDGTFELIEPFASYPINIHGITVQEQWHTVAQTLYSYIVANQVAPDRASHTGEDGIVLFPDLDTGLYFVQEAVAENTEGTYVFNRFLIYLPTPQADGSYDYTVEAKPKCTAFIPKTQYTVTKLWQDAGSQVLRPKEVTVDIYQDGILQKTQVLSAANNWSYTWQVDAEDTAKWTVVERTVKDPYEVTIRKNGAAFSIVNTWQDPTDIPPTGDTFALLPMLLIAGLSGVMLLLLGLRSRRAA